MVRLQYHGTDCPPNTIHASLRDALGRAWINLRTADQPISVTVRTNGGLGLYGTFRSADHLAGARDFDGATILAWHCGCEAARDNSQQRLFRVPYRAAAFDAGYDSVRLERK